MVDRVSILIPTRDREKMLARSLRSALKAARANDEIIVIDDASRTSVSDVVNRFGDPRVSIVRGLGMGPSHARNLGIAAATGGLIFFLDDDDEIVSGYINSVVSVYTSCVPRPRFGYAPTFRHADAMVDQQSRLRALSPSGYFNHDLPFGQRLNGFGMGFWCERSLFDELGLIDETMQTNEDTEFLLRITQARVV